MTITPPYKNKALGLTATVLALGSVIGSTSIANAATFSFSFTDDGLGTAPNGTVTGLIELPDAALTINGTYAASSVIVTSAPTPSDVSGVVGVDFAPSAPPGFNAFQVIGGNIVTATVDFFSQVGNFSLDFEPSGTGGRGILDNTAVPGTSVDSGTTENLQFAATTPEPTSVITLIGVGVLGVASKLKKKA